MAFTARDVLWSAQTVLQDANNRRWTLEELRVYINDGLRQIAFLKPTATSRTEVIELAEGTYQELPEDQQMLRAIRNITSAQGVTPRVAGSNITPIDRAILDAQFANWHATASVAFSDVVTHVVFDEMNPRVFYTFPGNTGNGQMEAIVSVVPTMVAAPGNPLDLEAYTAEIDLPDLYQNTLRDYVLSRAYEKDAATPGSAQRAVAFRNGFHEALGAKQQVETVANVNTD